MQPRFTLLSPGTLERAHRMFDFGLALANAGRDSATVDELKKSISHDPRESRAHYVLGVVTQRLGRTQEARIEFAIFLGPPRVGTHRE